MRSERPALPDVPHESCQCGNPTAGQAVSDTSPVRHSGILRDNMNDATAILREALLGRQLSAVTFIMDYFQFDFDGNTCTVFTVPETTISHDAVPNFRDRLCMFIAEKVTAAEEIESIAIHIDFGATGRLTIPLDDDSRIQVEAAEFRVQGKTALMW
jgi:hypothetical protein